MLTRGQFRDELQEALNHLHDPDRLGRSPLVALLGVSERINTYTALQDLLTEAIGALKPGPDVPADSRAWRIYELLSCRYVQELSPPEVAHQLGLSVRHMHREQAAALDALARYLWDRFSLAGRELLVRDAGSEPDVHCGPPSLQEELAWLRDAACEQPADVVEALKTAIELAGSMAQRHRTLLEIALPDHLPGVAVHPVGLNQLLLNMLTASIRRAASDSVSVTAQIAGHEVEVVFRCAQAQGAGYATDDVRLLAATREVADLCGVSIAVSAEGLPFAARIGLPLHRQVTVLAIDDNADTLRLLEHYMLGSRYRLVGAQDPEQALALAAEVHPQVIVLDVMMPQVDGWRLLGRLREHPATGDVPVVVCTIMAQEELAFTLGAAACLRKPVTQAQFLETLDQQVGPRAPGSR
jgi:CheY-like chemotaxis protein